MLSSLSPKRQAASKEPQTLVNGITESTVVTQTLQENAPVSVTHRFSVAAMENLMGQPIPLDESYKGDPKNVTPPNVSYQVVDNVGTYSIFINGGIGVMSDYADVLDALHVARKDERVYVYITSPGGYINTGASICHAIESCQAIVTTIATGMCASAGSLIWCAGHVKKVTPFASIMFHMSLHGDWGDSRSIMETAQGQVNYIISLMRRVALEPGYVTQQEFDDFTQRRINIWISGEEMIKRIKNPAAEVEASKIGGGENV